MRAGKKWLASLMALALLVCSLPAALAADWDNAAEVKSYDELTAALKDEKVEEIKITGEVTVPEGTLEANKPILVGKDGAFKLASGAVVTSNVPQGKFSYEDAESTWIIVGNTMETFVLYANDSGCYRVMYGTQPEDMNALVKDTTHGKANVVCFNGKDVELTESVDASVFDVRGGKNLTLAKDVSLKAGMYFNLEGSLVMNEGAKLEVPENNDVDGDATFASEDQKPANLHVDGEVKVAEKPAEPEKPTEKPTEDPTEAPAVENPFTDVAETSPFYKAILWAVDQKITAGTSATTFSPANPCTRAQILTFLWRAAGSPEPASQESPYSDVVSGSINGDFYKAILWAAEKGIADKGETFGPNEPCTRASTVVYLWKYAGSPEVKTEKAFTDVAADAEYAGAVAWAVAGGVTTGTSETTFAPDTVCSRGHIVTFLNRSLAK